MEKKKATVPDPSAKAIQSPSSTSDTGSKSGSSKSDEVSKDGGVTEQDLTVDNATTPIDLECHIQAERITKMLDETIFKTKVALCLPDLVQEYHTLSSMLTSQHMDDIIFIFEQYENPILSSSLLNAAVMEDIKAGDVSLKNRLNPELAHLLYILNSYKTLRPIIEEMVAKKKEAYQSLPQDKEIVPALEYLLVFEQFRELMVKKMDTTAAEELTVKFKTKKLFASNEKYIQQIKEYSTAIKDENQIFENEMMEKARTIAKLEQELAVLNQASADKLKKRVLDSDRQMAMTSRRHNVKNEMLKEEEGEAREGYESILRMHVIDEKAQRLRRFKVETQLLSWLSKYDNEMTDKQVFFDDLDEKLKDETEKVEKLEADIEEQDKEYIPLMDERLAEYNAEMTAKLEVFRLDHAARVIQTAYRQVLANRTEKRKLKVIWKKIKEERDRQLRIQEKKEAEERKAQEKLSKKAKKG